ncbi:hypothetical protein P3T23_009637 [Paraburkholderia sp. GAS448]|uniref:hypothetical protein n=1 Tax=Paraburkholderia sp. GAS448 TaxID=3035136 RepID=UPI003D20FBD3
MTFVNGRWNQKRVLLRVLLTSATAVGSTLAAAPSRADATGATEEICMPEGTYPMTGGGTTAFSHKTCFSRPATTPYPWEKKLHPPKKSSPDLFNGAWVVRYDYHDALYHCAKRDMRLPTVEELTALLAYANTGNSAASDNQYAIVAPKNDSRYPGGLHGWGGSGAYWSHTFAGKGVHKVVNLGNGRVSIDHDVHRNYVSCVR